MPNSRPAVSYAEKDAPRVLSRHTLVHWQLVVILLISTNTYLPCRVELSEFNNSPNVRIRLLNGAVIVRPRRDLLVVRYCERLRKL